jgi:chemotaxis protein methyltransferase CheR
LSEAKPDRSDLGVPALGESDFNALAGIVHKTTGIHLPSHKREMVTSRLLPRLRELGLSAFKSYRQRVQDDAEERLRFLERMCTHETRFFREPEHFESLEQRVYPGWLAAAEAGERSRQVRVWSAACSTGQEPFSFAMHLHHRLAREGFEIEVVATDVSTRVLALAKLAIWADSEVPNIPQPLLRAYMLKGTRSQAGKIAAGDELRQLVRFERLNLNDASYRLPSSFDLVICRNVLIYFDGPTRQRVCEQLMSHLKPGGYLILGHAESVLGRNEHLKSIGSTVYRKESALRPGLEPRAARLRNLEPGNRG